LPLNLQLLDIPLDYAPVQVEGVKLIPDLLELRLEFICVNPLVAGRADLLIDECRETTMNVVGSTKRLPVLRELGTLLR
jgi:hypothetical protein